MWCGTATARWILVALLLTACAPGGTPSPSTHSIGGTLTLSGANSFTADSAHGVCAGKGGFVDIVVGAQVTIKDQTGAVIGLTNLDRGTADVSSASVATCTFPFLVADVPTATFYSIEISHRGEVRYAAADLAAKQWSVALTLGGS